MFTLWLYGHREIIHKANNNNKESDIPVLQHWGAGAPILSQTHLTTCLHLLFSPQHIFKYSINRVLSSAIWVYPRLQLTQTIYYSWFPERQKQKCSLMNKSSWCALSYTLTTGAPFCSCSKKRAIKRTETHSRMYKLIPLKYRSARSSLCLKCYLSKYPGSYRLYETFNLALFTLFAVFTFTWLLLDAPLPTVTAVSIWEKHASPHCSACGMPTWQVIKKQCKTLGMRQFSLFSPDNDPNSSAQAFHRHQAPIQHCSLSCYLKSICAAH